MVGSEVGERLGSSSVYMGDMIEWNSVQQSVFIIALK